MATKKGKRRAHKRAGTKAHRRTTTRRQGSKRKPPNGFATWSAYMASIRPGGNVAKKKSSRRSGAARRSTGKRRSSRRRGASSMLSRGGGGSVFGVRNIINSQMRGLVSAGTQIGAEVAAVSVRQRILPNATPSSVGAILTDLAIGTALGMAAQKFLGRDVGQNVITGVYAGAMRRTAKGLGIKAVNDVLGAPDGAGVRYVNRGGRWVALSSYPGTGDQRSLSGYVGTGDQRMIGGGAPASSDDAERELYGA